MTRSAGPASSLKVNVWLSRGKRISPLVLDPIHHLVSGKSQIFPEFEMWDAFEPTPPRPFVNPGRGDAQKRGDLFHGGQFVAVDPAKIDRGVFVTIRDHLGSTDGTTPAPMCVYALLTDF
jgi:hypothetical protein